MNNFILLFIASFFSFCSFAQQKDTITDNGKNDKTDKTDNPMVLSDKASNDGRTIVSYRVEETVAMGFGGSTTVYIVPSLDLIDTNDLGPNNKRVVTPIYANVKKREMTAEIDKLSTASVITAPPVVEPVKVDMVSRKESTKYANIIIPGTYERVIDKGYKTVNMLKEVGDSHFFAGDLNSAAKWYTQLFDLTTDLDAVYYYRYAQSLKSVGQIEKANDMMVIFKRKKM